jgi:Domain of unknown function (DUF222)
MATRAGRLLADISPLRESPAFRRLWVGSTLSAVGGALTMFAVPLRHPAMCTVAEPASVSEALRMLHAGLALQRAAAGFLAKADVADLPTETVAEGLRELECADAAGAAVRGRFLEVFDAQDGPVADGQRTARTWLVHVTRVTKGQAAEYRAVQALARDHPVLLAALAEGAVLTKSGALQVARWTRAIPEEFRTQAEEIVVAAALRGADLRGLAAICAEIRYRTAPPDPDDQNDRHLDRSVSFATTFDGAGVMRGDLTPECAAMVQAALDARSAPEGGGDLRTRPQRYHDALVEKLHRDWRHISFARLFRMQALRTPGRCRERLPCHRPQPGWPRLHCAITGLPGRQRGRGQQVTARRPPERGSRGA